MVRRIDALKNQTNPPQTSDSGLALVADHAGIDMRLATRKPEFFFIPTQRLDMHLREYRQFFPVDERLNGHVNSFHVATQAKTMSTTNTLNAG